MQKMDEWMDLLKLGFEVSELGFFFHLTPLSFMDHISNRKKSLLSIHYIFKYTLTASIPNKS